MTGGIVGGLAICAILAGAIVGASATQAQAQTRYQTWGNPDAQTSGSSATTTGATSGSKAQSDARLQSFIDQLNGLVTEAEKARAADPRFLRDLRDLAQGFDRPWKKRVLSDAFTDGDFTRGVAWQVTLGDYFIEQNWGLRNRVTQAQSQATNQNQQQNLSREQQALQIFGAILGQATGATQQQAQAPVATGPQATAIHTAVPISNAFAVSWEMSSWIKEGRFTLNVYQGSKRAAGYRLVYNVGGAMELHRYSSRGTSVIDATRAAIVLEDKQTHAIEWTRGTDGAMAVTIGDKQVLATTDRAFRDPFTGVELMTHGGDFIIKQIAVDAVP